MNTKRITEIALLSCAALMIHVLEGFIPPVVPIPGVKLGLSNIITGLALYRLQNRGAVLVVLCRVLLGCAFAGSLSALVYALSGSALSLLVMMPLRKGIPPKYMSVLSVAGALAHNTGQILVACVITHTPMLLAAYLPVLLLCGGAAGLFTGLCATFVFDRLRKAGI